MSIIREAANVDIGIITNAQELTSLCSFFDYLHSKSLTPDKLAYTVTRVDLNARLWVSKTLLKEFFEAVAHVLKPI